MTVQTSSDRVINPPGGRRLVNPNAFGAGIWAGFKAESGTYGLSTKLIRTLRRSRIVWQTAAFRELATNPAFLGHLAKDPVADPLFFLSHAHYIARGLTAQDRVLAALTHYNHEISAFNEGYLAEVYQRDGLLLWSRVANGVTYEIRLQPGNDVLYEGGISVVLFVDKERTCVLSYSMVPAALLLRGRDQRPVMFVSRKHLTHDYGYQQNFNRAFHRCMPAHLCLGALTGIALGLGHDRMFGIAPDKVPAWTSDRRDQFATTYAGFWESLAGQKVSELGYQLEIPLHLTPLADLDGPRRKRAMQRRGHMLAVQLDARRVISAQLRRPVQHPQDM